MYVCMYKCMHQFNNNHQATTSMHIYKYIISICKKTKRMARNAGQTHKKQRIWNGLKDVPASWFEPRLGDSFGSRR